MHLGLLLPLLSQTTISELTFPAYSLSLVLVVFFFLLVDGFECFPSSYYRMSWQVPIVCCDPTLLVAAAMSFCKTGISIFVLFRSCVS